MLRKWQFVAQKLEEFGLPDKLVEYAKSIDETLCKFGLDYPTYLWREFISSEEYRGTRIFNLANLYDIVITNIDFCTACEDAEEKTEVYGGEDACLNCKLGNKSACTPKEIHGTDWYGEIGWYVFRKIRKLDEENNTCLIEDNTCL